MQVRDWTRTEFWKVFQGEPIIQLTFGALILYPLKKGFLEESIGDES